MSKLKWAFVFGLGYVAGSAAGRQRYEQIKSGAQRVAGDPRVQSAARQAQDTVAQKAPVVAEAIKDKGTEVAGSVADRLRSVDGPDQQVQPAPPAPSNGSAPLS